MNLFRSGLFCLFFMLAGNLLAEDVTITIDVSSLSGTDGNYIWNSGGVSGTAKCAKCNDYNCLKFSSSSNNEILNTTSIPGSITSVTIVPHNVNDANSLIWYVRTYTKAITTSYILNTSSTYWGEKDIRHGNGNWIIDKNHGFFYLHITNGNHCDIDRIIITYQPTPQPLTLVAQQNETYYATFSNTQPTFFPSAEGVKIMTAYVDGDKLNTPEINNDEDGVYVPANTGVLVSSASQTINYLYSNNKAENTVGTNMLHPATEEMSGNNLFYKLAYDNYTNKTGLGFYWGAADGAAFGTKAGTAYLAVPKSSGAKGFHFDFGGETSVEALERSDSNATVYNLQGQKVADGYRGIYIIGGKKYFKK